MRSRYFLATGNAVLRFAEQMGHRRQESGMLPRLIYLGLAILLVTFPVRSRGADGPARQPAFLYVATYSPMDGEGIFVSAFDRAGDGLAALRPTGGVRSPAALAVHPGGQFLYATTLVANAQKELTGGIVAFAADPSTGELREIDRRPSGGTGPCFLSVEGRGQCLLVAHCGTASVACVKLKPDGRFGESSTLIQHEGTSRNSEGKPQAHSIIAAPGNRFAIAADLGLDRLFVYRLHGEQARLTTHDPPFAALTPGAGPRHLAFHPHGRFAYSVNELGNTVTVCTFDDESGTLQKIQDVSTLPGDFRGESYAAEIQVHPSGRFLYASNRGHDSLAIYAIDARTGRLDPRGHQASLGKSPRHFAMDPAGGLLIVANQKSDQLVVFRIDHETGRLHETGMPIAIPQPVYLQILSRP